MCGGRCLVSLFHSPQYMAPQAEEALLYEVYLHAEHEDAAGDAAAAEKGPVSHRNAQRPTSHRSDQQKHARTDLLTLYNLIHHFCTIR